MPRMRWCVAALLSALIGAGSAHAQTGSTQDGSGLREWLVGSCFCNGKLNIIWTI